MRNIESKMVKYLDDKLAKNGLAQEAIKKKDARTLFVLAAQSCVGIRESGGNNKGPMVELIQETIGGADREPWCMSFQMTLLAYAELKTKVKSPLVASEHCLTVWKDSPKSSRVKMFPAMGAIIIWQHGTSQAGHTGVFLEAVDGDKNMLCIEGNAEAGLKPDGTINRNGGGVYATKRSMTKNGNMKVLGFLRPF